MKWKSTKSPPRMGKYHRPRWRGQLKANFVETSPRWFWLWHPSDGVVPHQIIQRKYDKYERSDFLVLNQDEWCFERWAYWMELELPEPPEIGK